MRCFEEAFKECFSRRCTRRFPKALDNFRSWQPQDFIQFENAVLIFVKPAVPFTLYSLRE
jgi:hypothetical protein